MADRVMVLDFRNGEWAPYPTETTRPATMQKVQAWWAAGRKPKDIGMKRVGPWRENTWPEGSREAEYEL